MEAIAALLAILPPGDFLGLADLQYHHWLVIVSVFFVVAERLRPARRQQRALRPQLLNDLAYLALYGYAWWWIFGGVITATEDWANSLLSSVGVRPEARVLDGASVPTQFVVYLLASDFLQWCVHNLLHRVGFLWRFHKVHHSVHDMDWAGNFRFHWMEMVVYKTLLYVPLFCWLGGSGEVLFWVAVFSTFWGHFNHSNVDLDIGPLGYVFNSPRMHLWHHDRSSEGGMFKNYGIVFSMWDFLFGTAYWPRDRAPDRIGYPGDEEIPRDWPRQLLFPLWPSFRAKGPA